MGANLRAFLQDADRNFPVVLLTQLTQPDCRREPGSDTQLPGKQVGRQGPVGAFPVAACGLPLAACAHHLVEQPRGTDVFTPRRVYGADGVNIVPAARKQMDQLVAAGFGDLPVCIAKTQYSLSDDPTKLGRPTGFDITVREFRISAGAGFIVALTGAVMVMPGLSAEPAAEGMKVHADGTIEGLF